jgi:hypothetical protein
MMPAKLVQFAVAMSTNSVSQLLHFLQQLLTRHSIQIGVHSDSSLSLAPFAGPARQALIISQGRFSTFIERPLSALLRAVAVVLLVIAFLPAIGTRREKAFVEGEK